MFSKNAVKSLFLLLFVVFALALPCSAANSGKPTVAVIPFSDQSPRKGLVDEDAMVNVREDVETDIVQTGKFRSLTRTEIARLLDEIKFDHSGLVDPATAAKYGKMVGAQYLVLGTLTGLGNKKDNKYTANVSLRMIEVETAEIFLAGRGTGKSEDASEAFQKAVDDALYGQRGMLTMLNGNGAKK